MTDRVFIFSGPDIKDLSFLKEYDLSGCTIIAADCGMKILNRLGITPHTVIGDFDSMDAPSDDRFQVIRHKVEKDDTDTMLCIRHALDMGASDITIVSGLGDRLDHTIANIQSLGFILSSGARGRIISSDAEVFLFNAGSYQFKKKNGFSMSLFSYSEKVRGLSISGAKYETKSIDIDNSFPIGASNCITDDICNISFSDGILLIVFSRL